MYLYGNLKLFIFIQAVHKKGKQEDDRKIMNKKDLSAIIKYKKDLYIQNRRTILFLTRLFAIYVLRWSI